jgi:predicted secreted protein
MQIEIYISICRSIFNKLNRVKLKTITVKPHGPTINSNKLWTARLHSVVCNLFIYFFAAFAYQLKGFFFTFVILF